MFIAALCGGAAWTAEVTIVRCVQPPLPASPRWGEEPGARPRRGRVRAGAVTGPAETRCGRDARAPRAWSSRRCTRIAWTAAVTIVRRVQPPSQPPPAGGRSRVPAPSGGGSGQGRSPCPRRRDAGGTPALPGHVHRAWCAPRMGPNVNIGSRRGVWGNRVSPRPRPAGGWGNRVSPSPRPREGLGGRSPHTPLARPRRPGGLAQPHGPPAAGGIWSLKK